MDTYIIVVVFAAAALLAFGVLSVFFGEQRMVGRRLAALTDYESQEIKEAQPLLKSFSERFIVPVSDSLSKGVARVGPVDYRRRLEHRIALAGEPGGLSPNGLLSAKLGLGALIGFLGLLPGLFGSATAAFTLLLSLVGLVGGFMLPDVWLSRRREERQSSIRRDLPDMLEMLTISVEAGLGFDAALSKYVKNSRSVLAYEFGRVLKEIQGGMSRKDSLRRLERRTEVAPLSAFITAMIQADMLGTTVAGVLRTQASEIRLRHKQYVEEQAQKLPVKMVFPVILCILPATLIVLLGPAVFMLMQLFSS